MDFFIETRSKLGFNDTLSTIVDTINQNNWRVLVTHNLQEILKNKGFDVLPVAVVELCTPRHSSRILSNDNDRVYSNLMPCRISVYEKADGHVYISRMNAPAFAKDFGDNVSMVMNEAFFESEAILQKANIF